jgi:hypothetical protein
MTKDDPTISGDNPSASSLNAWKLAENEVMSRKPNEKVSQAFDFLNKVAQEDGQEHLLPPIDPNILFFCECSDEKCKERIELKKSTYDKIHQNSMHFLLVPGHNIPSIERIVQSEDNYLVVEKFQTPPDNAADFNPTDLHNSEDKT